MQQSGRFVSNGGLSVIVIGERFDENGLRTLLGRLKSVVSSLIVVLRDTEKVRFGSINDSKLVYITVDAPANSPIKLDRAIQEVLQVNKNSAHFLIFDGRHNEEIHAKRIEQISRGSMDFASSKSLGLLVLSRSYAEVIAKTGEEPTKLNAKSHGLRTSFSIAEIIRSPSQAIRNYWTLVKFAIVGVSGVVVNLVVVTILFDWLGLYAVFANALGVELSILNNFVWNDTFTFRRRTIASDKSTSQREDRLERRDSKLYRLVKYNLVSAASFAVNTVVFTVMFYWAGLWYVWCSLIAVAAGFVINYFGSSRWAWRYAMKNQEPGPNN